MLRRRWGAHLGFGLRVGEPLRWALSPLWFLRGMGGAHVASGMRATIDAGVPCPPRILSQIVRSLV
ncbi:MAG: hypothetical protein HN712_24930 [Gemmatimonadetes bacterium]|nr:hypothetical protein [Gemmatimonadota bacterium]MBT6147080.1 hypothetical protein [Gemmatimonadota bacterium]MBT7863584.1 hypothetical protein [Gemmatimonadota bacterium]